jgi:hypothetical protein
MVLVVQGVVFHEEQGGTDRPSVRVHDLFAGALASQVVKEIEGVGPDCSFRKALHSLSDHTDVRQDGIGMQELECVRPDAVVPFRLDAKLVFL